MANFCIQLKESALLPRKVIAVSETNFCGSYLGHSTTIVPAYFVVFHSPSMGGNCLILLQTHHAFHLTSIVLRAILNYL
jgi:hypothetical protein